MMCEACERGEHQLCGMQTWCACECDPDGAAHFESGRDEWGCLFGADCCMPDLHFTSECHTAEMMEQLPAHFENQEGVK